MNVYSYRGDTPLESILRSIFILSLQFDLILQNKDITLSFQRGIWFMSSSDQYYWSRYHFLFEQYEKSDNPSTLGIFKSVISQHSSFSFQASIEVSISSDESNGECAEHPPKTTNLCSPLTSMIPIPWPHLGSLRLPPSLCCSNVRISVEPRTSVSFWPPVTMTLSLKKKEACPHLPWINSPDLGISIEHGYSSTKWFRTWTTSKDNFERWYCNTLWHRNSTWNMCIKNVPTKLTIRKAKFFT